MKSLRAQHSKSYAPREIKFSASRLRPFGADTLEEKYSRNADHAEKRQHAEIVDIGQDHCLARDHAVNDAVSLFQTSGCPTTGKRVRYSLNALLHLRIVRIDVVDQRRLMGLTAA